MGRKLTVAELAQEWKLHAQTIYCWIRQEKIPFRRFGGAIRFDMDEVNEWSRKRGSRGRIRIGEKVNQW